MFAFFETAQTVMGIIEVEHYMFVIVCGLTN